MSYERRYEPVLSRVALLDAVRIRTGTGSAGRTEPEVARGLADGSACLRAPLIASGPRSVRRIRSGGGRGRGRAAGPAGARGARVGRG